MTYAVPTYAVHRSNYCRHPLAGKAPALVVCVCDHLPRLTGQKGSSSIYAVVDTDPTKAIRRLRIRVVILMPRLLLSYGPKYVLLRCYWQAPAWTNAGPPEGTPKAISTTNQTGSRFTPQLLYHYTG